MNLRLRLIVAFFLLSVVPLGAVTLYTYTSNAKALRDAAQHEAQLLADELTQRMQLVTSQLSERVAHLMDAVAPAATAPAATADRNSKSAAGAAATATATDTDKVAETLGDVTMLLNNIVLTGTRPNRPPPGADGRQGPRGPGPGPGNANPDRSGRGGDNPNGRFGRGGGGFGARDNASPTGTPNGGAAPGGGNTPPPSRGPDDASRVAPTDRGSGQPPDRFGGNRSGAPSASTSTSGAAPQPGAPPGSSLPPAPPSGPRPPQTAAAAATDDKDRIEIDMMPIRRELFSQFASEGQWDQLSQDERQRIIAEVNQRMLGIEQGIRMGAAELQKKVSQAQQAADAKAHEIAVDKRGSAAVARSSSPAPVGESVAPVASVAPMQRKTALSGSHLDVTMERNGQVVHQVSAEVNVQNLLMTVFTTTRGGNGEVQFAVAKDGHLYTPTDDDRKKIEALGAAVVKADTPPGTSMVRDWVVVTMADPTGSGLKFGIARPVGDSLNNLRRTTARNASFGLMFIVLAIVGIVPVASRLTRNLSRLSDGVRRIANGDYRARVEVRSHDEIGRLAVAFNQMAEDIERHQRAIVGQERIKRELELGRQIQHDMLPQTSLMLGLTEIKGVSVPAREVGGDFFNYFELPSREIALLVGDVSGKGVGAALLMANIQASLRTRLALGQDLAALAREIDADVEANTPGPVYATLFVGILDPVTRQLRYVNAGHHPQYVLRGRTGLQGMPSTGLPVGLLAGRGYSEQRMQLEAGDLLFFYTDGCVEAENEQDEMFGAERLEALLMSVAASGADDLLARVETAVSEFRGTREPFDDATMMAVKVG